MLKGVSGDDILIGGGGDDTFFFDSGQDKINDFDAGLELINLKAIDGLRNYADVASAATVDGNDVVFEFDDASLTLKGVDFNDLSSDNFLV